MVWSLIAANALVFLYMLSLPQEAVRALMYLFGAVPARFTEPEWAASVGFPEGGIYSYFTYMFMHGGFFHFLINMWTMWIFADNIEDVMGPLRFLIFYVLCGLAALGTHMFVNPGSTVPVVGASGAIAGVMGAYFLLYPHSRVVTLIPIIIIPWIIEIPAVVFLGIWFLIQFSSGVSAMGGETGQGIAWWAHAGGFLAGMALLWLFRQKDRCKYCSTFTGGQVDGRSHWQRGGK
jgi:membrane associated rhomboid family serine protease